MKAMIEITLRRYNATEIQEGFISASNVDLVTEGLQLKHLTNEELSMMWEAVQKYFEAKYARYDNFGKICGWQPYSIEAEHARDTSSAWLEVINKEARSRRNL